MTLSDSVEQSLWDTAERLRGSVGANEYRPIVLGILFLQDANHKYEQRRDELKNLLVVGDDDVPGEYYCQSDADREAKLTDPGLYAQSGAAYIPEEARWEYLISHARTVDNVSELLDDALAAIEDKNKDRLEGKLPKNRYQRANINNDKLASVLEEFDDLTDRDEVRERLIEQFKQDV